MRRGGEESRDSSTVRRIVSGWRASPRRHARLVAAAGLLLASAGCATKKDVKVLGDEIARLQARQDSLFQELRRDLSERDRAVLDSLHAQSELLLRVRGDLGRQLLQMEQQLVQIQELTGQSQRRISELRAQWESRTQEFETPVTAGQGVASAGPDVTELYELGVEKLREGATSTARAAFEEILNRHVTHELAPDAQYQIGETYVAENEPEAAMRAFDRLIELFPSSSRAPTALFRAGIVAEESGNISRARDYFTRVQGVYPDSDEARLAAERLRRLQRR